LFREEKISRLNVAMKNQYAGGHSAWRVLFTSSGWRVMIAAIPPTNA